MDRASIRGAIDEVANSEGRSAGHILAGLALTAGAVVASAMIARANAPSPENPQIKAEYDALEQTPLQPPRSVFGLVWPPLFLALTVSGLRIWNAPRSQARNQALALWGAVQGLNALWMALGPRRLGAQFATALASLGTSLAYLRFAREVDPPASAMVSPYVGWISFANVLTGDLMRRNGPAPTIH